MFLALTATAFIIGKSVDAIQLKKAYYLRKYFISGSAVIVLWILLDSGRQVIVGEPHADLIWFGINAFAGFIFALIAFKISQVLDLRKKITRILVGLPVYSRDGQWIGSVESIVPKESVEFKNRLTNKTAKLRQGEFELAEGRIILT